MFVNIHTHSKVDSAHPSIRNLTFPEAERIFSTDEIGLYSVGFHPWHVDEFSEMSLEMLEKWVNDKRLILIGECGLDKNCKIDLEKQIEVFKKQISLSELVQKPLIIHCVGCFNELLKLKRQLNPEQLWIIHGFRGKPELAKQVLNAGCSLSFGEHFNAESVYHTPVSKLFAETDESQLSIKEIYSQIAIIKRVSTFELNAGKTLFEKITS